MAENQELEALDQLVNSEGWRVFRAMVEKDWGPQGARFVEGVTNAAKGDDLNAMGILRQILASQREIQYVLNMPVNRLKLLKQHTQTPELVGQSRRGSL
jgi:hypothetical protein